MKVYGQDRVNTFTNSTQQSPAIATLKGAGGGYVVTWSGYDQDAGNDTYGIFAQRYNASGVAVGPEFRVNTTQGGNQTDPAVVGLSNGDFVVVWTDESGADGSIHGVYAQRYNASGVAQGSEFLVNTHTSSYQYAPTLAAYTSGFVVAWASYDIDGSAAGISIQRYNNSGVAQGVETLVNTAVGSDQYDPDVAARADGSFVVVWTSSAQDGDGAGIYAQRFNTSGVATGAEFKVNTTVAGAQYSAKVAILSDGSFVVVWNGSGVLDGSGEGVFAQRYNSSGVAQGGEFLINESTNGSQYRADVEALSTGGFVVTWYNDTNALDGLGSEDVFVREFSNAGVALGGEQRVNTPQGGIQYTPAIADIGLGNFAVVWTDTVGSDGSGYGIFQQLFGDAAELPRQANPTLADFGGTQNFGENAVNAAPQALDVAVSVTDSDSANFNGGRLTAFFTSGATAQDQLTVINEGNGAGQIGVSGSTVRYGNVQIGTMSGGVNGADLVVTLNSSATPEAVEELVQHLGYRNTSGTPNAQRSVSVRIEDGDGGSAVGGIVTINVTAELDGTPKAYGEERVNTYTPGTQAGPEIAALTGGGYVTVWHSQDQDGSTWGVYGQLFTESGVAVGPEFRVPTLTGGEQSYAHVAGLSDGGFIVTWQDNNGNDGSGWGNYGQRYNAAGLAQGGQFLLNTTTSGTQYHDAVTAYAGGGSVVAGFAAVWTSDGNAGGSGPDIVLQRFNNAGTKLGGEVLINTTLDSTQQTPDIASYANGNLVIVWEDNNGTDGSGWGVFGRRYDATAGTLSAQFQVNNITAGGQWGPQVATLSNNGFVVVWTDDSGQDGSLHATFARVFNSSGVALGNAFIVNESGSQNQYQSTVTGLSTGGFVVTFYNDYYGADGTYGDVYVREYDNAGNATDGERRVNTEPFGLYQSEPAIADIGDGNFVVTWRADSQDGGTTGVYQQVFGSTAELPRQANPDLGDFTGTVTFGENAVNAAPQLIDMAASITDSDSANFNGGRLDLYHLSGGGAEDQLSVLAQSAGPGQITVAGNVVSYGGTAIGTISGGANGANLRIDFTSDSATPDAVEALVQRLAYANTSSNPHASRALALRVSDGDGGSSTPNPITINVTAELDGTPKAYGEERVNTYTPGTQAGPEIAALTGGGYVTVWHSQDQDGSTWGVYGQLFTESGVAVGPEFRVPTLTGGEQSYAHVAGLSDGGFIVTWQDNNGNDGSGWGNYGQRYNAAGLAQGGQFLLNTTTSGTQYHDAVTAYAGGGSVVAGFAAVWTSDGNAGGSGPDIVLQRFNNAGTKLGGEVLINTTLDSTQQTPDIASYANGNLVIVWEDNNGTDGSGWGVFGRRYDATAGTLSAQFQVNNITAGGQWGPQVATLSNNGFVVVWTDDSGQDGSLHATFARVFNSSGVALGNAFIVNESGSQNQYQSTVTGLSTGGFVVTFYNDYYGADGTYGDVYVREYDNAGNATDGERRVNTEPFGLYQSEPAIADIGDGNFVVTWRADSQDGGTTGVYQQVFGSTAELPRQANPGLGDFTGTVTFGENALNAGPQVIDAAVSLSDLDSANFNGGRLDLYYTRGASAQDQLSVLAESAGPGRITVSGNVVSYGGTAIGTVSGGANGANLRIDFTSDTATPDAVEALVQRLAYANTSSSPQGSRDVALRVSDGDGGSSLPNELTINVTPEVDGAPKAYGEERVNTYAPGAQHDPEIAALTGGGYVTVWQSQDQDGSGYGVYGQLFTESGVAVGPEFRIPTLVGGEQSYAHVAGLSDGGFVVTWQDNNNDGSSWGNYGQRYNAAGVAQGGQFLLNTTTSGIQYHDAVTAYAGGGSVAAGFAAVWTSDANAGGSGSDIVLQRFNNAGTKLGGEVLINTTVDNTQQAPDVASYANGNLVIVWEDNNGTDGSSWGVFGRRYDATAGTLSAQFQVNNITAGGQWGPQVATLSNNGFVVVWTDDSGQDGSSYATFARVFSSSGVALGNAFIVNESSSSNQYQSTVTGLSTGGFVVSFYNDSYGADGTYGDVYIREYDNAGNAIDGERRANTESLATYQYEPAIADIGDGNFVVAWRADGQDSGTTGVYQQVFGSTVELPRQANPVLDDVGPSRTIDQTVATSPSVIDADANVTDIDSANFSGGRLQVFFTSGADANDRLAVASVAAPGTGQFNVTGSNVFYQGTAAGNQIGTVSGGTAAAPLTITFNSNATQAIARALVENITYHYNTGPAPLGSRTVAFRISDGGGGISDPSSVTIDIVASPVPVLKLSDLEPSITVTEAAAQGGVIIDVAAQLDAGSSGFNGGTLTVSYTVGARAEDQLSIQNQGNGTGQVGFSGGTVSYQGVAIGTATGGAGGTTLTVTFNASATAQAIERVIENLRYQNTNDGPFASRTIQVQVTDAGAASTSQSVTINVTPQVDGAQPLFGDVQVNTYEPNHQLDPRVATLEGVNAGGYVVVWRSQSGQDGSVNGIFGQRYNAVGGAVGAEFQVNSYVANEQTDPEAAALSNGGFVVVWRSEAQDGSSGGIYAQRYDASGVPSGGEFRASTVTGNDQTHGTALGLPGGGFVLAWADAARDGSGYGVFGQRYAADGSVLGAEFQINTTFNDWQHAPALARLVDDPATAGTNEAGFVAVWQSSGQDGSSWGIYGQRFDVSGAAVGAEFQINTNTTNQQADADVATLTNGDFVVVWQDYTDDGVHAQRYTAGGLPVGSEFTVTTPDVNSDYSRLPHVAALGNGGFVVTWDGYSSATDPDYGVYVQQYNAAGARVDGVLALGATTANNQHQADVSGLSGGNFVGVWESLNQEQPVNASHGIFSRIWGAPGSIVQQASPELLDLETSATFTENTVNAGPQIIDPGVRVVDANSADFNGGRLVVSVIQGYGADQAFDPAAPAQDNFSIRNEGAGAGQVGVSGSNVTYGGVTVGTIVSNGQNGADLVVQWNAAAATPAAVEAVIENLTYRNPSSNPTGSRQVSIVVSDGDGAQSTPQIITINVAPQVDGAVALIATETQVNTYVLGEQSYVGIGALQGGNDGQYVVVWRSFAQDSDSWGVFGQRYDVNGSAIGPEFQINTTTPGAQPDDWDAGIGGLSTGGFVVTWESPDGYGDGIFAQRFDAAGIPVGTEFRVSPDTNYEQTQPRVLGLAGGAFVIAWADDQNADANSYGVRAQHYNASGVAVGSPILINENPPGAVPPDAFTLGNQSSPQLALLNNGGYVVAWHSLAQDGDNWGVFGRLMNANGTPAGNAFQINTTTLHEQVAPDVATLVSGQFVVTWRSYIPATGNYGVIAQTFSAAGAKIGGEVVVHDGNTIPNSETGPTITALETGGYVIAWHSSAQEILAQQFDAAGGKIDTPLQLNNYTASTQYWPAIAALTGGRFVAAWQSYAQETSPADDYGIYQNLFGPAGSFSRSSAPQISDVVSTVTVGENTANAAAGVVIDSAVSVLDADSANFAGGSLTVSVIQGYSSINTDLTQNLPAQDQFFIRNQGSGAGQVDVSGSNVRYGGVTVGTIASNGANGADLVVQWNASATPAVVEAVIENIVYRNTSTDPVGHRTVSLFTSDGDGATSAPRLIEINVNPEADAGVPLFSGEQVNTYITSYQERPDVARLSDGGYVIVWESEGQDGWADGVYAQRYAANGTPISNEFKVNEYTPYAQYEPAVAALNGGGFVVTYTRQFGDSSGAAVFAQRYDASAQRAGSEFMVNTATSGSQYQPHITPLNDGGFAVAWYSDGQSADLEYYDVFFQRYNASGVAQGTETRANTPVAAMPNIAQYEPNIIQLSGGGIVVAWRSDSAQDGSLSGVYAQRFNSAGVAQGAEFQLNATTENYQYDVHLARLGTGFVAIWTSRQQDGDNDGIYGRLYNASGAPTSAEFRVNESNYSVQDLADVASLANGGFAVTWDGYNPSTGYWDVFVQQYDAAGNRLDGETRVSDTTSNAHPAVAGLSNGNFVVTWQGNSDGDVSGIFQRIVGDAADFPRQAIPQLVDLASSVTFLENDVNFAPQVIDPGVGLFDADSTDFSGGRLDVSYLSIYGHPNQLNVAGIETQDQLGIRNEGTGLGQIGVSGTTVSYEGVAIGTIGTIGANGANGAPLSVVFNAAATPQAVEALIENLTYRNPLSNPEASRTLSVRVSDGDGGVIPAQAITINVMPQPDGIGLPFHAESTANTTLGGDQLNPALARLSDGTYVVVWQDHSGTDTSSHGVYGQRYDASDNKAGGEFLVNTTVLGAQYEPDVVALSGGGFAVAWRSDGQDGSGTGVYMQRFTSAGVKTGAEVRVNTDVDGNQYQPAVTQGASGGFIVAWYSDGERDGEYYDVFFQRFSSTGAFVGGETRANTAIAGNSSSVQSEPSIALLTGGDFVVTWRSEPQDGSLSGVYAQRFNGDGTNDGVEFRANTYTANYQYQPQVAALTDGGYVIVWNSRDQDTSGDGIYGQRFNAAGAATGGEFRVNYEVSGTQNDPTVTGLTTGGFVVSWSDDDNIWFQQYNALGVKVDSQQPVNATPLYDPKDTPDVVSMPDGGFVIAAHGYRTTADGGNDTYDIRVQRYEVIVVNAGADASVNEGSLFSRTVTFTDPVDQGAGGRQVIVDWDDGSARQMFDIAAGAFSFNISHTFADNRVTPYGVVVTVNDSGLQQEVDAIAVTVNNVPPTAPVSGASTVNEGSSYALSVGAVTDPGADTRTGYSINWGDSVTDTFTVAQWNSAAGSFSHTYADGASAGTARTVTVSATDEDGTFTLGTKSLTVNNVAPTATVSGASTVNEGASYALTVGAITEPGADTRTGYSINWGDGVTQNFTVATWNSAAGSFSHAYADGASAGTARTVTVSATDEDGTFTLGTKSLSVNNVAPTATVSGASTVNEGASYALTVGAITEPGADTRTGYSINWGDGVTQNFTVATWNSAAGSFSHAYADGASAGTARTVTVSATDEDGTFTLGTKSLTVNNVAPTATVSGASTVNEGASYALTVGAITEPGADTRTGYSINWGDGVTQNFTVATWNSAAGSFSHAYADGASAGTARTVTVSATDEDGTFTLGTKSLSVNNVAPTATVSGASTVNEGASYALTVGAITEPGADTRTGYSINWGDGVTQNFTVATWNSAAGSFSHAYADGASAGTARTVTVSATDEDGTFTLGTKSLSVNNVAPTATVSGASTVNEGASYALTVGAITEPGADTRTGYSINWGDGVTQNLSVAQWNAAAGSFSHTYGDVAPSGGSAGETITVSATDEDGTFVLGTKSITVNDPVYRWSEQANNAVLTAAQFNPGINRFLFDIGTISAADLLVRSGSVIFSYGGKTVTIDMDVAQVTTTNVFFQNGSMLVVGDNSTASVADSGANALVGGSGNDQLLGLAGADSHDGGGGTDFASYSTSAAGVQASLGTSTRAGDAVGDTYVSIEGLIGTNFTDTLQGDANANELRGLDGADTLHGHAGTDTLRGGAGADALYGGAGADVLDGGADADYARYDTATALVRVDLTGTPANNSGDALGDTFIDVENVVASPFADEVRGNALANVLQGRDGNDQIWGAAGDDTLQGGNHDDTLEGGAGADLHDGGAGTDFASYSTSTAGLQTSLGSGARTGDAAGDTYTAIEGLIGTNFNDTLQGDANANELRGLDAADSLYGHAGADTLRGGAGADALYGGADADVLDGGADADYARYDTATALVRVDLTGAAANNSGDALGDTFIDVENVVASAFADEVRGNALANVLQGRDGNDQIWGDAGNDTLQGGNHDDTLEGGAGADLHDGGAGTDFASYSTSTAGLQTSLGSGARTGDAAGDTYTAIEGLIGTNFNDTLQGDANANELRGLDAADSLYGHAGADTLRGGAGADALYGGADADVLDGGADADYARYDTATALVRVDLTGTPANNSGDALGDTFIDVENVVASAFADEVRGNALANVLQGRDGNDLIWGDAGNDTLQGGNHDDTLEGGAGADLHDGGAGTDFASYAASVAGVQTSLGSSTRTGDAVGDTYAAIEGLIGTNFNDTLQGDGNANELRGLDAADSLYGYAGTDTLRGGAGADALYGGAGADVLDGGADTDYARYDTATALVRVDLTGTPANNSGDALGDTFIDVENVVASAFADEVRGNALANVLQGRDGNDLILGAGGDDTLQGGNQDDTLEGGIGADLLVGEAGNDTFRFTLGEANGDRVQDFAGNGALAGDSLVFQGYGAGATFVQTTATTWQINHSGGSEVITFLNAAAIDASDYTFV